MVIVGDAFHDDQDSLDEAAISANQLRRAGTRLFLIQQGDDPVTARKLQYLARVSGGAYFPFDPRTQERQFSETWKAMSAYATGGGGGRENDGRASGDIAAGASEAGADADRGGARACSGEPKYQEMTDKP